MVKIYCEEKKLSNIKGKIYNENGLLYPKIMILDTIMELQEDLRRESKIILNKKFNDHFKKETKQKGCLSSLNDDSRHNSPMKCGGCRSRPSKKRG